MIYHPKLNFFEYVLKVARLKSSFRSEIMMDSYEKLAEKVDPFEPVLATS